MIDDAFGEVLRRFRKQQGLSQQTLAEATDLSRPYISELERGVKSPSLRTVFSLASALGISPSRLMAAVETELTESNESVSETVVVHNTDDRSRPAENEGLM